MNMTEASRSMVNPSMLLLVFIVVAGIFFLIEAS